MKQAKRGFTIIELIVALAILGVLVAVIAPKTVEEQVEGTGFEIVAKVGKEIRNKIEEQKRADAEISVDIDTSDIDNDANDAIDAADNQLNIAITEKDKYTNAEMEDVILRVHHWKQKFLGEEARRKTDALEYEKRIVKLKDIKDGYIQEVNTVSKVDSSIDSMPEIDFSTPGTGY